MGTSISLGLTIGGSAISGKQVPFTFTIDTTSTFQLPLVDDGNTLNAVVNWGDGTSDTITTYNQAETLHTYASSGTYTIKISGDISGWQFGGGGDRLKMREIQKWGVFNISIERGFWGCTNMTCTAVDYPNITTTLLTHCFRDCFNFNGAIGNWDVSNVTGFANMFNRAFSFNQDIGNWDTSSATSMAYMFNNATSFNQDISNWDITQVSSFVGFMINMTLSTTKYDALLIGWEATLQSAYPSGVGYPYTINIGFGNSQYTLGSASQTARTSLIVNFGWTISDGGGI